MGPIPFEVLPAMVVFDGLLAVFAFGEVGIRIVSSRNAAGSPSRELTSFVVLAVVLVASMAGALVLAGYATWAAIPVGRWGFFVAGVAVVALGLALRFWSVVVLGRSFTVEVRVREGQEVVDRGPYRVVRHPSYTGLLAVFLGTGLALGNWLALAVAVVPPVAAVVFRILVEERALLTGMGGSYRGYAAGRSRLLPRIW